jgi:hypothetical protein
VAGAVGTVVIEAVSYGDMLLRGRAPSELPGDAARWLAAKLGVDLGSQASDAAHNRAEALGALLSYASGVTIGAFYGLLARSRRGGLLGGLALGAAAILPANLPMVAMDLTDLRTWGLAGWISDIVPHLVYGLVTTATYRAITTARG